MRLVLVWKKTKWLISSNGGIKHTLKHDVVEEKTVMAAKSRKTKNKQEQVELLAPARPFLVGIGASAGGLEAISALLSKMSVDLAASYVVIQHLSPTYRSMMVQLLGRETQMLVREITDQLAIEPNTVNIAPASHNVVIENNCFRLTPMSSGAMPRPSVNLFLMSLAEQFGEAAMAVILSGTGSDGSAGIRAIKAAGGYTFAQLPSTAKYTGMPQAAIDTDSVDWVLSPEAIANEIANIIHHPDALRMPLQPTNEMLLKKLLARVRLRTKVDFSCYKETTLWRRIERRMAANYVANLEDYLHFTEEHEEELERLCKDVLISVTAFFRDSEAFAVLDESIAAVIANKQAGDEIRMWVPACATGEEAFVLPFCWRSA